MNKQRLLDRAHSDVTERAAWYAEAIRREILMESSIDLIPDLTAFDDFISYVGYSGLSGCSIYLQCPWDTKRVDELCLELIHAGWELQKERNLVAQSKYYEYVFHHPQAKDTKDEVTIQVDMHAEFRQSKCELVEDHREVSERIIWKVVCKDMENV